MHASLWQKRTTGACSRCKHTTRPTSRVHGQVFEGKKPEFVGSVLIQSLRSTQETNSRNQKPMKPHRSGHVNRFMAQDMDAPHDSCSIYKQWIGLTMSDAARTCWKSWYSWLFSCGKLGRRCSNMALCRSSAATTTGLRARQFHACRVLSTGPVTASELRMYTCMYVCMCVCMHSMCVCMYIYTHTHVYPKLKVYIYTQINGCEWLFTAPKKHTAHRNGHMSYTDCQITHTKKQSNAENYSS
jgi:hypothetical protein